MRNTMAEPSERSERSEPSERSAPLTPVRAPAAAPTHTLFAALSGPAREELLAIVQPVSFMKGAVLLRQGAPTRGAFFLRIGMAEAAVRLPGGESLVLARVGAGGVIGEMALLEHGLCSATVTATEAIDGLFIGRDDFRVMIARRSPAALAVQRAVTLNLCAKLSALNAQILTHPATEDASYTPPSAASAASAASAGTATAASVASAAPSASAVGAPPAPAAPAQPSGFEHRRFLPVLPLFRDWDEDEINDIANRAQVLTLKRGQPLFYEGTEAGACYITVRGAIDIAVPVRAQGGATPTHLRRLAVLGPGQLIGHRSLIDGTPHAARARACEDCVLLVLPRAQFLELLGGATPASLRLQSAVHGALLRSMAHTNVTLTRLVNLAKVDAANRATLEAALAELVLYAS